MPQLTERRAAPRRPAAFTIWCRPATGGRHAACVIDLSRCGAGILIDRETPLRVGDRLELEAIPCEMRTVERAAPRLPTFARIVRMDRASRATRRVGLAFDGDSPPAVDRPAIKRTPPRSADIHTLTNRSDLGLLLTLGTPPFARDTRA